MGMVVWVPNPREEILWHVRMLWEKHLARYLRHYSADKLAKALRGLADEIEQGGKQK